MLSHAEESGTKRTLSVANAGFLLSRFHGISAGLQHTRALLSDGVSCPRSSRNATTPRRDISTLNGTCVSVSPNKCDFCDTTSCLRWRLD